MIKTLLLVSAALILSSCASTNSSSMPAPPEASPATAQSSPAATQAPAVAASKSAGSADNSETAAASNLEMVNNQMEVVEVEGFKDAKKCRMVATTGSRIKKKHCQTAKQDNEQREAGRRWMETIKNRPAGRPDQRG